MLEIAKKDQTDLQENIEKAKRKRLAREHALAAKAAAEAANEAREKQKEEEAAKKRAEQGEDVESTTVATVVTAVSGGTNITPHSHQTPTTAASDPLEDADKEDALDVLLNALGRSDDELFLLVNPFGEAFQEAYTLLETAQQRLVELLQLDNDGIPQVDPPLLPFQAEDDDHTKATRQTLFSLSISPSKAGSGTHTPTHTLPLPTVNFSSASAAHTKASLQWETIDLNAHPWYVVLKSLQNYRHLTPSHFYRNITPLRTLMKPLDHHSYRFILLSSCTSLSSLPPLSSLTPSIQVRRIGRVERCS